MPWSGPPTSASESSIESTGFVSAYSTVVRATSDARTARSGPTSRATVWPLNRTSGSANTGQSSLIIRIRFAPPVGMSRASTAAYPGGRSGYRIDRTRPRAHVDATIRACSMLSSNRRSAR